MRPATQSSHRRRGPVPGQQWCSSVRPNPTPRGWPITCPDAPGGAARDHCGGHVSLESRERSGNSRRCCFAAVDHRSSRDRTVDVRDDENLGPAAMTVAGFQGVGCGRRPPFKVTTPDMSASPRAYAHLAVVEYNMHPVVPGRGSGIFLHVQIGKATSGCISLRRPALLRVLRWLDPASRPEISIGVRLVSCFLRKDVLT